MPIRLTPFEERVAKQLVEIKKCSGSHSPSPAMLAGIKGVSAEHDFCYLSNPHATELFLKYFRRDFRGKKKLHTLVEHYPSQNRALAEKLKRIADVPPSNIFVGNGATEIIQAVLHTFAKRKILVPVPTFSPYLEFAPQGVRTVQHKLQKKDFFRLNLKKLLEDVRKEGPDTVVIINPSNPDGGGTPARELQKLLVNLRQIPTVIVDESFSHLVGERIESVASLVKRYPNLVVIKSMSKDFGIAGLRLGYAVMSEKRVSALLERGYLWNVSGFGEYFLDLLNRRDFLRQYEQARLKAIGERDAFFRDLQKVRSIKVYPSKANMFLVELLDGTMAEDLTVALLCRFGIYVRDCADKVGLNGEFIRIASRTKRENQILARALCAALSA
jgi:histidinol-phosphate/aromatic aminotransferase/cobyric acid decarboxylase-like protein